MLCRPSHAEKCRNCHVPALRAMWSSHSLCLLPTALLLTFFSHLCHTLRSILLLLFNTHGHGTNVIDADHNVQCTWSITSINYLYLYYSTSGFLPSIKPSLFVTRNTASWRTPLHASIVNILDTNFVVYSLFQHASRTGKSFNNNNDDGMPKWIFAAPLGHWTSIHLITPSVCRCCDNEDDATSKRLNVTTRLRPSMTKYTVSNRITVSQQTLIDVHLHRHLAFSFF